MCRVTLDNGTNIIMVLLLTGKGSAKAEKLLCKFLKRLSGDDAFKDASQPAIVDITGMHVHLGRVSGALARVCVDAWVMAVVGASSRQQWRRCECCAGDAGEGTAGGMAGAGGGAAQRGWRSGL